MTFLVLRSLTRRVARNLASGQQHVCFRLYRMRWACSDDIKAFSLAVDEETCRE